LLSHAWMDPNCSIPNDDRILAALCGLPEARWTDIGRTVVERAFNATRGNSERLFNARLLKERRIAEGRSRQAKKAGKRSGEVRAKGKKKRP